MGIDLSRNHPILSEATTSERQFLMNRIGYPEKPKGYPLTAPFPPCNSEYSRWGDCAVVF